MEASDLSREIKSGVFHLSSSFSLKQLGESIINHFTVLVLMVLVYQHITTILIFKGYIDDFS